MSDSWSLLGTLAIAGRPVSPPVSVAIHLAWVCHKHHLLAVLPTLPDQPPPPSCGSARLASFQLPGGALERAGFSWHPGSTPLHSFFSAVEGRPEAGHK